MNDKNEVINGSEKIIKIEQDNVEETQYFLMTIEDEFGKRQQMKIYQDSNASELAFNFCRQNNYDYISMKHIKKNIEKIIKKFDEPDQKVIYLDCSNSSIQEVDEENLITEGTGKNKCENISSFDKNSRRKIDSEKSSENTQKPLKDVKEENLDNPLNINENINYETFRSNNREMFNSNRFKKKEKKSGNKVSENQTESKSLKESEEPKNKDKNNDNDNELVNEPFFNVNSVAVLSILSMYSIENSSYLLEEFKLLLLGFSSLILSFFVL